MNKKETVECTTLHGEKKTVNADSVIVRPVAYGIIVHDQKILLVNTKSTGKWFFPGGGLEKGETTKEALRREVQEETGIEIEIKNLFEFHESFFYYDPWQKAFHTLACIYECEPKSFELDASKNEKEDEAEKPQWIAMETLKADDFQSFVGKIFEKYYKEKG